MAGAGVLDTDYYDLDWDDSGRRVFPAAGTPIGEREIGTSPGYSGAGNYQTLWYKFVPPRSGVVSIDLYLSTKAGSDDQTGVNAESYALQNFIPGWQPFRMATEWSDGHRGYGNPEYARARYYGWVTEGLPVLFDVWGEVDPGQPVDVVVRISDVTQPPPSDFEEGPKVVQVFTDDESRPIPNNTAETVDYYNADLWRITDWQGQTAQIVRQGTGPGSKGLAMEALKSTRRLFSYPDAVDPQIAVEQLGYYNHVSYTSYAFSLGYSVSGNYDGSSTAGKTYVTCSYGSIGLNPVAMARWAGRPYGYGNPHVHDPINDDLGAIPDPPDDHTIMMPTGFSYGDAPEDGIWIKKLEVAPGASTTTAPHGRIVWTITRTDTAGVRRPQVPDSPGYEQGYDGEVDYPDDSGSRWGPTLTNWDNPDIPEGHNQAWWVANQRGPESLLKERDAQVIKWLPTDPVTFTEVDADLMKYFLARSLPTDDVGDREDMRLVIVGATESLLSDSIGQDLPEDFYGAYGDNRGYHMYTTSLYMRVTYVRRWRPIPKPQLFKPITGGEPTTRRRFTG